MGRDPTGIVVTRLDISDLQEDALEYFKEKAQKQVQAVEDDLFDEDAMMPHAKNWDEVERMTAGFPLAAVETDEGIFVIDSDGVGPDHPISEGDPLPIDFFPKGDGWFATVPALQMTIDEEEVREIMTGEEMDLADHIRVHGSRLEVNLSNWVRHLKKAGVEVRA